MPNYNPYQYMGASGYGSSPSGYGQNWAYGQQGSNNPYQRMQQGSQNYQQSYQNPYQTPQGYPQGRFPGSSNQFLSPTQGGKGTGYGGFGNNVPGGMVQGQRGQQFRQQDPWQVQMDFHQKLLMQRQMEEALGAQQGWAWDNPFGRNLNKYSYARPQGQQSMGEYEQSSLSGPYGNRGW